MLSKVVSFNRPEIHQELNTNPWDFRLQQTTPSSRHIKMRAVYRTTVPKGHSWGPAKHWPKMKPKKNSVFIYLFFFGFRWILPIQLLMNITLLNSACGTWNNCWGFRLNPTQRISILDPWLFRSWNTIFDVFSVAKPTKTSGFDGQQMIPKLLHRPLGKSDQLPGSMWNGSSLTTMCHFNISSTVQSAQKSTSFGAKNKAENW